MLPLVRRKRRKESGWEREVVKRHRVRGSETPADGRNEREAPGGEGRKATGRGDEQEEEACARTSEGERTGARPRGHEGDGSRERETKE